MCSWKSTESCLPVHREDTWTHSEAAAAVGHLIINLSNNKKAPVAWRGLALALTLSNYHTSLWWSIWVKKKKKKAPGRPAGIGFPGSVCCERQTGERVQHRRRAADLWLGTGLSVAQGRSTNQWRFWQASFCWFWWPPLARYAAAAPFLPGRWGREWGSGFCVQGHAKQRGEGKKKGERGDNKNGNTARCLKLK